jgi:pyruvate/2-oxoglutarate dehydrogenase complex dihydrolipoamide acyltransferase (E2) component
VPPAIHLHAPFAGTVVAIVRNADDRIAAGEALLVLEAMKMEHEIPAEIDGLVRSLEVAVGQTVEEGQLLAVLEPGATLPAAEASDDTALTPSRDDLSAVRARHDLTLDAARPDAVARRHEQNRRTARENLNDLVDPGSFVELRAADVRRAGAPTRAGRAVRRGRRRPAG